MTHVVDRARTAARPWWHVVLSAHDLCVKRTGVKTIILPYLKFFEFSYTYAELTLKFRMPHELHLFFNYYPVE